MLSTMTPDSAIKRPQSLQTQCPVPKHHDYHKSFERIGARMPGHLEELGSSNGFDGPNMMMGSERRNHPLPSNNKWWWCKLVMPVSIVIMQSQSHDGHHLLVLLHGIMACPGDLPLAYILTDHWVLNEILHGGRLEASCPPVELAVVRADGDASTHSRLRCIRLLKSLRYRFTQLCRG